MADAAGEKARVFIATPAGGGAVSTETIQSVEGLQDVLAQAGHVTTWCRESWSGLDRTRNIMVAIARQGNWSHLLWVDRDMVLPFEVGVAMLLCPFDLVGLAYPKKAIDWPRVFAAARDLARQPSADPRQLALVASPTVGLVTDPPVKEEWGGRRFYHAEELGTGVMAIKMPAFNKYIEENEARLAYRTDYLPEPVTHHAVFIEKLGPEGPDTRRFLTEDYVFTREWKASGRTAYLLADARVGHVGRHTFWSDRTTWKP